MDPQTHIWSHIREFAMLWPVMMVTTIAGTTALVNKIISKKLYLDDGTTMFVTRAECMKSQNNCSTHICGYLVKLDKKLDKLETGNVKISDQILKVSVKVANLEGNMNGQEVIKIRKEL